LSYEATSDKISVDLTVSISRGRRKNEKVTLSPDDKFNRNWLTRRNILSIINGIYDPLGLASPITIKLRVAIRNLFQAYCLLGWDDPINSVVEQDVWLGLVKMLVDSAKVTFPRATTPLMRLVDLNLSATSMVPMLHLEL
jgi:hypothetical protein